MRFSSHLKVLLKRNNFKRNPECIILINIRELKKFSFAADFAIKLSATKTDFDRKHKKANRRLKFLIYVE